MPCSKTGRTIKYSPWYHLCSEEAPPHSKTRNGGWPLPLARAGRQNSRATSSPPSRKLAPAASSLGIPCGSTALLHRLLQYSGILLYLSPEVKRNSPLLPAASPLLPSLYYPNCVFIPLFSRFPQRLFSAPSIFAGFPSYSCKIMKEFSQIVFPYICNNIPLFLPNSSRIFKIKKSIQKLSAAISFSRKFFVIKKIKKS